jgi:hypothetical protein
MFKGFTYKKGVFTNTWQYEMYVFIFFLLFRVIYNLGSTSHTLKFEVEDASQSKEFNLVATKYTTETMELPTGT